MVGCTSTRRRMYRLAVGENKKITAYPAEGHVTVGVMRFKTRAIESQVPAKADKGVEKSCRLRARRQRGQRKGKKRSRGGKPRSNSSRPTPNVRSVASTRSITRTGRMFSYWAKRQKRLVNLLKNHQKVFQGCATVKGDYSSRLDGNEILSSIRTEWQSQVNSLMSHVKMGPIIRAQYYGRSFFSFRDSHTGHKKAKEDWLSLLDHLEVAGLNPNCDDEEDHRRISSFLKRVRSLSSVKALRCANCRSFVNQQMFCPKCRRKVKTEEIKKTRTSSGYSAPRGPTRRGRNPRG